VSHDECIQELGHLDARCNDPERSGGRTCVISVRW
jgi:hypothetical protein